MLIANNIKNALFTKKVLKNNAYVEFSPNRLKILINNGKEHPHPVIIPLKTLVNVPNPTPAIADFVLIVFNTVAMLIEVNIEEVAIARYII